jgi:hypothetical protein
MIRRVAVFLLLGALMAIPGVASPAKKDLPVPTAGAAHLSLCGNECTNSEDTVVGRFSFMGGLSLDGGSYQGTFAVDFVAQSVCPDLSAGCRLRIDSASVYRRGYTISVDFCVDFLCTYATVPAFGPAIGGSCHGILLLGVSRLTCSFSTATGLSGTRTLLVVGVEELYNWPCDIFCEPYRVGTSYVGVYTPGNLKSL